MKRPFPALFVLLITLVLSLGCKQQGQRLGEIQAGQIRIDSTLEQVDSLETFIEPYRNRLNEVLDIPLCYAPHSLSKTDGALNSSLGNLMADIILKQADMVFQRREGKGVDIALHNYGGMRTAISRGAVTERTAFEVMPFENAIVIVEMSGATVRKMVDFLARARNPHPVAGRRLVLDADGRPASISVQGRLLEDSKTYYVATSDYLVGGGNGMTFLEAHSRLYKTGYKIRNAMIDYFREVDTLTSGVDDRVVQLREQ